MEIQQPHHRGRSLTIAMAAMLLSVLAACNRGPSATFKDQGKNEAPPPRAEPAESPKVPLLLRDAEFENKLSAARKAKQQASAQNEQPWLSMLAALPREDGLVPECLALLQTKGANVTTADFAPDHQLLALGSIDRTDLWDLPEGKLLHTFKASGFQAVRFDSKSSTLGTMDLMRTRMNFWDIPSRRLKFAVEHGSGISGFHFFADGKSVATASYYLDRPGADFTLKFWDAKTGKEIKEVEILKGYGFAPIDSVFSPDGEKVAGAIQGVSEWRDKGAIFVWRVNDGALLRKLAAPGLGIARLAFAPDGWRLAISYHVGTGDSKQVTVLDWDLEKDIATQVHKGPGGATQVLYTPDGQHLIFGDPLSAWNVARKRTSHLLKRENSHVPLAIASGGTFLCTGRQYPHGGFLWEIGKLLADSEK